MLSNTRYQLEVSFGRIQTDAKRVAHLTFVRLATADTIPQTHIKLRFKLVAEFM
eukprot:m.211275 g.211275  ORF g.211275 m.211275 type:complete len:54 (+) comp15059_c1_seq1:1103-1264(+)